MAGSPYAIVPSNAIGSGLGNYTITYDDSGTLDVTPAPLSITAASTSKVYGATDADLTYSTTGNLYNGDSITGVTLTSAGTAGTATVADAPYAIVPSNAMGSGLSNYAINYDDSGTLDVTPAPLVITAADTSKVYGATGTNLPFTTTGTLYNGDAVTGVTETSIGASPEATVLASPYLIAPSNAVGQGLGNYKITYRSGFLSVTPYEFTVTIQNDHQTYGTPVNLAADLGTTITTPLNETLTIVYSVHNTSTAHAGTYPITGFVSNGTGLTKDYTVLWNLGTLTISPAPISYTIQNNAHPYGSTANLAADLPPTFATGINNQDLSIAYSSSGNATTTHAGTSPITGVVSSGTGGSAGLESDYVVNLTPGKLTITPAR